MKSRTVLARPSRPGGNFILHHPWGAGLRNGRERFGKKHAAESARGQLQPTSGDVILNGQSVYQNLDVLKQYISYMPQQDASTNISPLAKTCCLRRRFALRTSHAGTRGRRLEAKLVELGLGERRDAVVEAPRVSTQRWRNGNV